MKESEIVKYFRKSALELGFNEIGITTAQSFLNIRDCLLRTQYTLHHFSENDIEKRIDPLLTMPDCKSIICLLFPYSEAMEDAPPPHGLQGKIVSGDVGYGEDYHVVVQRKLRQLCNSYAERFGGEYLPFCDTGPLVDKEIAVRSGICDYGRNSLAINEKHGSYFYIGYILTTLAIPYIVKSTELEPHALSTFCDECKKCADACPTGAISLDKPFEHAKCISYISQKKGNFTDWEEHSLNTVYGCHICQSVCPANDGRRAFFWLPVNLEEAEKLSNKQFKEKYCRTAAGWVGKQTFARNCRLLKKIEKK